MPPISSGGGGGGGASYISTTAGLTGTLVSDTPTASPDLDGNGEVIITYSVPPVLTVTSCSGSPSTPGSLPYEVANASSGDMVNFSVSCPPNSPIMIASTINIDADLIIAGPGAGNVVVSGNFAVQVFNLASGVTGLISGITIEDGNAINGEGGGISNSGTLTVFDTAVSDDAGSYIGGGILSSGTLTVLDSAVSGNTSGEGGGGIFNLGGTLVVSNSTLAGNTGQYGGGIQNIGSLSVSNSTISGNGQLGGEGGGIFDTGGGMTIADSTFSGNIANYGGAIDVEHGSLFITNSTLSGDTATSHGSELGNLSGSITAAATIAATATSAGACWGSVTDAGYNLDDDGTCGFTASTSYSEVAAQLDPLGLQANGGSTLTIALEPTSPGNRAVTTASLCSGPDQRGVARPTPCDIGAYQTRQQVIALASPPPVGAVGGPTYVPTATASSGLPVILSIDPSSGMACSLSGQMVTFTHVGTCVIDANQVGNDFYDAAPEVQQSIVVEAIAITTTALPSGTANVGYSVTLSAIGGNPPYTWKVTSGSLPKGFKLNKSTGVISGKTKQVGTLNFTIEVLDMKVKSKGHPPTQNTATEALSITISPA